MHTEPSTKPAWLASDREFELALSGPRTAPNVTNATHRTSCVIGRLHSAHSVAELQYVRDNYIDGTDPVQVLWYRTLKLRCMLATATSPTDLEAAIAYGKHSIELETSPSGRTGLADEIATGLRTLARARLDRANATLTRQVIQPDDPEIEQQIVILQDLGARLNTHLAVSNAQTVAIKLEIQQTIGTLQQRLPALSFRDLAARQEARLLKALGLSAGWATVVGITVLIVVALLAFAEFRDKFRGSEKSPVPHEKASSTVSNPRDVPR